MTPDRPIVVITGTSRDVGRAAALEFARKGFDIVGGHQRDKSDSLQADVVRGVEALGRRMFFVKGNLRDPEVPAKYLQTVQDHFPGRKIRALVGNAAEGWKQSLDEARGMNVEGTMRMVDTFLDHIEPGGVIVFNTSGPAHDYDQIKDDPAKLGEIPVEYHPVMITKNEAERAQLARIPEFSARNILFKRVVGNALDETFVTRALKRNNPVLMNSWLDKTKTGKFPTAEDMAKGDVWAVMGSNRTGHAEYVGISSDHRRYLVLGEIMDILDHRNAFLLIDRVLDLQRGKSAVAEFVTETGHPMLAMIKRGHFPGYPLTPGMIIGEGLNQTGAVALFSHSDYKPYMGVLGGSNLRFRGEVKPGELLKFEAEITGVRMREDGSGGGGKGKGKATNALGQVVAEGEISVGIIKRPKAA